MNEKGIKGILNIITKILSYICLAILIIVAIFLMFFIISNHLSRRNGSKPILSLFTIVSPSMEPNIKVYDVIVDIRIKNENELKVGDIITFYSDVIDTGGYTITHRIYDIYEENGRKFYITKGDNNTDPDDGVITFENIVGKVEYIIPSLGKIQFLISTNTGWIVVILIPALGIILMDIKKILQVFKIKNQIEEMTKYKEVNIIREKEEDKKLRAIIEEADRLNNK